MERGEVGVVERVVAGDRRLAGVLPLPRSEIAGNLDRSRRPGIRQHGLIFERLARRRPFQLQFMDVEDARQLGFIGRKDAELDPIRMNRVDDDGRRGGRGPVSRCGSAGLARRHVDLEIVQPDIVDPPRRIPQRPKLSLDAELAGGDQRRQIRPVSIRKLQAIARNPQTSAPRMPRRKERDRDVQRPEFHAGAEAVLQIPDRLLPHVRLKAPGRNPAGRDETENQERERNRAAQHPAPHGHPQPEITRPPPRSATAACAIPCVPGAAAKR